jgi:hypothetical protein
LGVYWEVLKVHAAFPVFVARMVDFIQVVGLLLRHWGTRADLDDWALASNELKMAAAAFVRSHEFFVPSPLAPDDVAAHAVRAMGFEQPARLGLVRTADRVRMPLHRMMLAFADRIPAMEGLARLLLGKPFPDAFAGFFQHPAHGRALAHEAARVSLPDRAAYFTAREAELDQFLRSHVEQDLPALERVLDNVRGLNTAGQAIVFSEKVTVDKHLFLLRGNLGLVTTDPWGMEFSALALFRFDRVAENNKGRTEIETPAWMLTLSQEASSVICEARLAGTSFFANPHLARDPYGPPGSPWRRFAKLADQFGSPNKRARN